MEWAKTWFIIKILIYFILLIYFTLVELDVDDNGKHQMEWISMIKTQKNTLMKV